MLEGKDIAAIRKSLGLSPGRFAALLDVCENTVRRWEIGDRHPRWETMEKINKLAEEANGNGKAHPNGKKRT